MKALKLLLALFAVVMGATASANQCPLGNEEKAVLQESAIRNRLEAAWIVNLSSVGAFPSRAYSRNLIGSTSAHTAVATLAEQCTAPRTFDEYCELCEEAQACPTAYRCSQLGCEQARVDTARIWWEPAPFEYTTDQPYFQGYRVRYAARPSVRLRYDARTEGVLDIQWIAADDAQVTRGARTVDARSLLFARGARSADAPRLAEVNLVYPSLVAPAIVLLSLRIDEHGVLTGSIRVNADVVANITEATGEEVVRIAWLGACAAVRPE